MERKYLHWQIMQTFLNGVRVFIGFFLLTNLCNNLSLTLSALINSLAIFVYLANIKEIVKKKPQSAIHTGNIDQKVFIFRSESHHCLFVIPPVKRSAHPPNFQQVKLSERYLYHHQVLTNLDYFYQNTIERNYFMEFGRRPPISLKRPLNAIATSSFILQANNGLDKGGLVNYQFE